MTWRIVCGLIAWTCAAEVAQAAAIDISPRPVSRPVVQSVSDASPPSSRGLVRVDPLVPGVVISLRPVHRPGNQRVVRPNAIEPRITHALPITIIEPGLRVSLRPLARPSQLRFGTNRGVAMIKSTEIQTESTRTTPTRTSAQPDRAGAICGSHRIRGEVLSPIRGGVSGCGIDKPVRVVEIDDVRLSRSSTMSCETARALQSWIQDGIRPAIGRLGGGIAELRVASHYACRTRNNRPDARISEHAKGNAIDISAFKLENGKVISVEDGWNKRVDGNILRRLHGAACGPFNTVLGPDADRFHQDHFHVDVGRHGGGRYCR